MVSSFILHLYGCTTTNLPLSSGIKIVSVLQGLLGEIGRTISGVQKRDISILGAWPFGPLNSHMYSPKTETSLGNHAFVA